MEQKCESCGTKLLEKNPICPNCCAQNAKRLSVKKMNYFSLILLPIALMLFTFSLYSQTTLKKVSELTDKDNFKHVRVEVQINQVYPDKDKNGVSLYATQPGSDSEKIKIKVESSIAKKIKYEEGDIADIEGILYIGKGYKVIKLASASSFKVTKSTPKVVNELTIESVLANPEKFKGQKVVLKGVVVSDAFKTWSFKVQDAGKPGKELIVFGAQIDKIAVGNVVDLQGTLEYYAKNKVWEVKISKMGSDYVKVTTATAAKVPEAKSATPTATVAPEAKKETAALTIAELLKNSDKYKEQQVTLDNVTITDIKGKWIMKVKGEGSDELTVFGAPVEKFAKGNKVKVQGIFEYYKKGSMWEIKIRKGTQDQVTLQK